MWYVMCVKTEGGLLCCHVTETKHLMFSQGMLRSQSGRL